MREWELVARERTFASLENSRCGLKSGHRSFSESAKRQFGESIAKTCGYGATLELW